MTDTIEQMAADLRRAIDREDGVFTATDALGVADRMDAYVAAERAMKVCGVCSAVGHTSDEHEDGLIAFRHYSNMLGNESARREPADRREPERRGSVAVASAQRPRHWFWQHRYEVVGVSHYESITGPRTVMQGRCSCGRCQSWTERGVWTAEQANGRR